MPRGQSRWPLRAGRGAGQMSRIRTGQCVRSPTGPALPVGEVGSTKVMVRWRRWWPPTMWIGCVAVSVHLLGGACTAFSAATWAVQTAPLPPIRDPGFEETGPPSSLPPLTMDYPLFSFCLSFRPSSGITCAAEQRGEEGKSLDQDNQSAGQMSRLWRGYLFIYTLVT
jgi:hypothetical protein